MKLGIFDSGLGGLLITKAIRENLPDIDIVYFGDTLRLPYGNRSGETIYEYSCRAMDFLFSQNCALVITACNTVSASALRSLQNDYLPQSPYSTRRILGVIVPTLETAIDKGCKRLGIIATAHTIETGIYPIELQKIDPEISIVQKKTPLLVPLIENEGEKWIPSVLEHYLTPMLEKESIEGLILGCTHYPLLKDEINKITGGSVSLIAQDEIIPNKLVSYLQRYPQIESALDKNGTTLFYVSDITQSYCCAAERIYGHALDIQVVEV